MPSKVCLITVYYNTPEELLKLSESVQKFLPENKDWIIIDNNSTIDLSARIPGADYVRQSENLGFARACNYAAEKSTAPYLFFVNPDCEFIEDCVTPLLAALDQAAIAAPRVLNRDGTIQLSFGPFLSVWQEAKQRIRTRYETTSIVQKWMRGKSSSVSYPDYVSGCALMISRDLFLSLGGFDTNYFLYEEDVDLCKRVRHKGLQVVYVPSARIVHLRNRSTKQHTSRAALEYRKSQLYYYRKHQSAFQQKLLRFYLSLKFLLNRSMRKQLLDS